MTRDTNTRPVAELPRTRWGAVLAVSLAIVLAALDLTIVAVALPLIGTDLAAPPAVTQWVLLAGRVLQGAFGSLISILGFPIVAAAVRPEHRGRARRQSPHGLPPPLSRRPNHQPHGHPTAANPRKIGETR